MLDFINGFNATIFVLFTLLYSYQIAYVAVELYHTRRKKMRIPQAKRYHRFAVIVCARNESAVIGQLVRSVKLQKYPKDLLDVFVVADNCTDDTAQIARQAGAIVYERQNRQQVGKGYALNYVFHKLEDDYPDRYEGYLIFDADNLLCPDYVAKMNDVFDQGYRVITSYRNSKNYDTNWISAGCALWFLREARYLNAPRMCLGTNCAVSGTGFLVASSLIRENNGWHFHLLTEDIEFSIDCASKSERIAYCPEAMFYDEQPITFHQSWDQRLRWSKGFYQVFEKYGKLLAKNMVCKHSFSCFDMFMTISPALLVSISSVVVNSCALLLAVIDVKHNVGVVSATINAICASCFNFYFLLFALGLLTTITEWKKINARPIKKILYVFTFPIFIFTYVPIAIVALFRKVEWKPIAHTVSKSIEELQ